MEWNPFHSLFFLSARLAIAWKNLIILFLLLLLSNLCVAGGGWVGGLDGLGAHFTVLFDKTGQHHHSFPAVSVITLVYVLM